MEEYTAKVEIKARLGLTQCALGPGRYKRANASGTGSVVARPTHPRVAHHITQRGNNRQNVLCTDGDRRVLPVRACATTTRACGGRGVPVVQRGGRLGLAGLERPAGRPAVALSLWGRGDLRRPGDDELVKRVRVSTRTGRPLASDDFLE